MHLLVLLLRIPANSRAGTHKEGLREARRRRWREWNSVDGEVEEMERWRRGGEKYKIRMGGGGLNIWKFTVSSCSFIQTDASNYTGFRFKEKYWPAHPGGLYLSVLYSWTMFTIVLYLFVLQLFHQLLTTHFLQTDRKGPITNRRTNKTYQFSSSRWLSILMTQSFPNWLLYYMG